MRAPWWEWLQKLVSLSPSWYLPINTHPSTGWIIVFIKARTGINSYLACLFVVTGKCVISIWDSIPRKQILMELLMDPAKINTSGEGSAFPFLLPSFITQLETAGCCLGSAPDHLSPWGSIKQRDQVFSDMANQKKNHYIGSKETWDLNLALPPTSCLTLGKFN